MNPQTRIKLIRDHMRFGRKYTASSIYVIYSEIMSTSDILINIPLVKFETLRDQLKAASNEDGWLVVEKGLYFKREPRCVFVEFHNRMVKLWQKLLS